jgi:hypothetical protein
MSPRRLGTLALTAALTTAGLTGIAAPATSSAAAAPRAISHLSEADALWLPSPTRVRALAPAPAALVSTSSAQYRFSSLLDGQPVRWDPCTPIHWSSNTARGPVGGLDVLKASVARIAALTGTTWVYDGATAATPSTAYLPKTPTTANKPVLLGWTDGTSSDLLAGRPAAVLGMTRTVWFGTDDGRGHRVAATRAAVVALDRTDRLPLRGALSWSATTLHELGHVMGLDHPSDTRQLMSATLPAAATDLQTGDRTGLARIGRAAGCVTVPSV